MKVLREGKIKEVKSIQVGDTYIDKCWVCGSKCLLTRLKNGHDRHESLEKDNPLCTS